MCENLKLISDEIMDTPLPKGTGEKTELDNNYSHSTTKEITVDIKSKISEHSPNIEKISKSADEANGTQDNENKHDDVTTDTSTCLICGDEDDHVTQQQTTGSVTCDQGHSLCAECLNSYVLRDVNSSCTAAVSNSQPITTCPFCPPPTT